ncbi:MAG: amino acid ABC transporter substrate-binding protein, partial [Candidatus Eremiobacteraeota bacterium]|nr:amino acid ABC transporter substrate-binding protein [Candidatus Eremiobacteraeota bacterium]
MRSNRRAFVGASAAFAVSAALPARAQVVQPPNGQFLRQLTIGINVTLSGPFEKYGQEIVRGVQAAVDEANLYSPSALYVWALRAFDDRNQTALAISNVSSAAADPTVVAVIGNLTAPMTL